MVTTTIVAFFKWPMKTIEEWSKEIANDDDYSEYWYIRAIQLDAWKQGMLDAADMCDKAVAYETIKGSIALTEARDKITKKANERTTINNS